MPQLRPSWQLSLTTAAALVALAVLCLALQRRWRPAATIGSFAGEFTLVMLLLAVWQVIGGSVHTRVAGALERGRAIDTLQHQWHLPSELAVQQIVLPHPEVVRAMNQYYGYAHLNGMAAFVLWMWWRHRDVYPRVRATVVASTLACFLVQIVPVAPPRLLPDLGFIDTAAAYGQSVYGDLATGLANQLSAMPSVHVGWATIVAWYVWWCAPCRWRWIGVLHLVITVIVVVGTANHWWLDGLVAAGFDALAILGGWVAAALWSGRVLPRTTTSASRTSW